jgi:hypothetical protein
MKAILVLFVLALLAGCGGDEDEHDKDISPPVCQLGSCV